MWDIPLLAGAGYASWKLTSSSRFYNPLVLLLVTLLVLRVTIGGTVVHGACGSIASACYAMHAAYAFVAIAVIVALYSQRTIKQDEAADPPHAT